ncbi:MAG: alpha-E domain-containing protein [Pseudomonadota bacterium]
MLGRAADALYWMGRYVERADNLARLIDVGRRTAVAPSPQASDWEDIIRSSGCAEPFFARYDQANRDTVVQFLLYADDSDCSIRSCLSLARNNARVVRTSLTAEMWEVIDGAWRTVQRWDHQRRRSEELRATLSWIKRRCALFRGVTESTVLRHEGYDFLNLGTYLERADCTARILDVRHTALDSSLGADGDSLRTVEAGARHHWIAILRASSSVRAYHWAYRSDYRPDHIVDLLVLNAYCSRSLGHCLEAASERLERLARIYARRLECHTLSRGLLDELRGDGLAGELTDNLHGFLSDFIARNNALSNQIALDYHFSPPLRRAATAAG